MMMTNNRILLSGNTAWGMYNFRHKLLEHLVTKGYEVYVAAPYDEPYFKLLEEIGCRTIDVPISSKGTNPVKDILLVVKYWRIFKRVKPFLSITYTIKPNIYGSLAAQWCGIRHLPVTTGLGYVFLTNNLTSKIAKRLYRVAFAKAPQVWFLNNGDIQTFKGMKLIADEKIKQLNGEGVDIAHFAFYDRASRPREMVKFLYVGRLLYDKGVQEYAEAARELKKMYPHVEFHVLGNYWEDNPSAISHETFESWVKDGYIVYDGGTSDVRPYLHDADCMVLPSYREGMSCSLMEAAATGLPLVATNVPGCRELVDEGRNGFLCRARDAESLREALERFILLATNDRLVMGQESRRKMEESFAVDKIIRQYDRYLDSL